MTGATALADVAERTDSLVAACTRCDRAWPYRLDTLIARHGAGHGVTALLRTVSVDCPKREAVSVYDLCGIHCPELSALFLRWTG